MSCPTYSLPEAMYKPRCVHQVEILAFQPGLITKKLRRNYLQNLFYTTFLHPGMLPNALTIILKK